MKRRSWMLLALAGMVAVLATACGSSSTSSSTASGAHSSITVCGDLSLSGVYAQIGQDDSYGAIAFFKAANAKGGVDGHPVHYVTHDNQSNATQAALIAKKCILQDHATWIFGPESGANTESALPIAIANKTIMISMSSGWQTNGYPKSELNSWGFPDIQDVFYQDDVNMAQQIIGPRHYTRVALIEDNCGPVCLANKATVEALAKQYHFQLVSTQIVPLGSTDMTPQVLALLAAKPQVILFGLVPGTDSITAIRTIRAQNPDIPLGECSGCTTPSFISAAGGPTVMQNIYMIGRTQDILTNAENTAGPVASDTAAGLKAYFAGMKVAGYTSPDELNTSIEGWDGGLEMQWAIKKAGSLDEQKDMQALQQLHTNTLGIAWTRTPSNYLSYSQVFSAMVTVQPDGSFKIYHP